jgi:arylsulfatase A-like enzyme
MERREFLRVFGYGVFLSIAMVTCPSAALAAVYRKPNIILCMADDQGWGDVAYNGHPFLKTPNSDAMATSALRFDRFYAAAPVCSPTRGSVMTGRHPNRFGCFTWGHAIRPQEITIAEALKTAGYVTGHFGKWHLGAIVKDSPVNPGNSGFDEWFSAPNFFDNHPILSREGLAVKTEGESSMVAMDAALEFIRRHAKTARPFLAVVWFGSPHEPHRAMEEDRILYSKQDEKRQHFYGEISGIDRALGKLRGALLTLGIHRDTILWYCSDNGGLPGIGTTGGRGHKGMIYEGGLRVPAILEWPSRIPKPRTTDVPCSTSDIYPTLLEITGVRLEQQPPLDGISLVPLINGNLNVRPVPIGFWDYPAEGIKIAGHEMMLDLLETQKADKQVADAFLVRPNAGEIAQPYPQDSFPGHAAWLDWPWKLHRIQGKTADPKLELYNLSKDPWEQKDLITQDSQRASDMKSRLEAWQVSVVNSLNGKDYQ